MITHDQILPSIYHMQRQGKIGEIGIMATPANSSYNELVIEAARESILNGGKMVTLRQ